MKTTTLAALVIGSGLITSTAQATDKHFRFPGSVCQPATPADAAKIAYSRWGVHNTSISSAAKVWCPLSLPYADGENSSNYTLSATVYIFVRRGALDCSLNAYDPAGNSMYGVGFSHGWADPNVQSVLMMSNLHQAAMLDYYWTLECDIPYVDEAYPQPSHISAIEFTLKPN